MSLANTCGEQLQENFGRLAELHPQTFIERVNQRQGSGRLESLFAAALN